MYYEQQLSNPKSNITLTWKILNRIINKNNSKSKISDIFICDDVRIRLQTNAQIAQTLFRLQTNYVIISQILDQT